MTQLGFSGLANLGNTCYINSVLQVMSTIDELNNYIEQNSDYDESMMDYIMTKEWIDLKKLMWSKNACISPGRFIQLNQYIFKYKKKEEFINHSQGDANEYLLFFLECIHNSYNKRDKQLQKNITHKYLEEYYKKDHSIISQLCLILCEYNYLNEKDKTIETSKIEPQWTLELSIPKKNDVTILDCFEHTFSNEILKDDNAWFNDKKNMKINVIKTMKICKSPAILIIHLKRWNHIQKNDKLVHLEESLDITSYSKDTNNKYELFGLINHEGNLFGGHYYSFVKKYNKWYLFNDKQIKDISFKSIIFQKNYCLFYRKIK
jgi:ubiquitin C-terminal hydrolase